MKNKNRIAVILICFFVIAFLSSVIMWSVFDFNAFDFSQYITISSQFSNSEQSIQNSVSVVEETAYYQIIRDDALFFCTFFDSNQIIIKTDGPWPKRPKVIEINKNMLLLTIQAGTGDATRWGYYYDTKNGRFSQIFQHILNQENDTVVYANHKTVVVQNIFDPNILYYTISTFENPLAQVASPFVKADFISSEIISITYLYGSNYAQHTEQFAIEQTG